MKTVKFMLLAPAFALASFAAVADEPAAPAADTAAPAPEAVAPAAVEKADKGAPSAEAREAWKRRHPEGFKKGEWRRPEGFKPGKRPQRPEGFKPGDRPFGPRAFGPRNVAIVIDCSAQQTARFEKMREAAIMSVQHLSPTDIVSVVSFAGTATVLVPAQEAGENKDAIIEKIKALTADGDAALAAGVAAGAAEVRKNLDKNYANNIMLFGGMKPNVGPAGNEELKTIRESLMKEKIRLFFGGMPFAGMNRERMQKMRGQGGEGWKRPGGPRGPRGEGRPKGEAPAAAPAAEGDAAPAEGK